VVKEKYTPRGVYSNVGQHAEKPSAHSSTFGFCRDAKPKQKTKRA